VPTPRPIDRASRRFPVGLLAAALLPLVGGALAGAAPAAQHTGHVIPRVPQELLERPVTIRTGIGAAHDAVDAASPEAQRFYDQGLTYLHSYVWIEAARSFHQALRLDPALAIAHAMLSVAYVEMNQPDASRAAMERAKTLAVKASAHDRRHVELRALQMAAEEAPADGARLAAWRAALDTSLAEFPQDVELHLARGVAESPDPADRGQGSVTSGMPHFERALALQPDAFAARHYLAHALENAGREADAVIHGREYARLAPEAPHARHMYGHTLRRMGRVDEAIAEFEAADRLARASFEREKVPASLDWHHHHNLDLLAASYQYGGQMKKAEAVRRSSFDLPSNLVVQIFAKRQWPAFLRARGRNADALAAARHLATHPHPLIQATGYVEAGHAQLALQSLPDAAGSFNAALKILRSGPEGAPLAATALLGLQAELALRSAARDKGREGFADVARRLRAAPGADNWTQATFTLEALARVARQVGDWELAGRMAEEMRAHDPRYAGTHYALALVAERNEDIPTARAAFTEAVKLWSNADDDLAELADAKRRLR
jgi:tetratricopeptide (TPR) repeat protein